MEDKNMVMGAWESSSSRNINATQFFSYISMKAPYHSQVNVFIWKHDDHVQLIPSIGKQQNFGGYLFHIGHLKSRLLKHHLHKFFLIL